MDHKIRLGCFVAPSGECTQSEAETLDLLLPQFNCHGGGSSTCHCLLYQLFGLVGGCEDCYLLESGVGN